MPKGKKGKGRGRGQEGRPTSSMASTETTEEPQQPAPAPVPITAGRGRATTSSMPLERPTTSMAALPVPVEQAAAAHPPEPSRQPVVPEQEAVGPSELKNFKPISRPKTGDKFQVCTLGREIKVRTNHFEIKLEKAKGLIYVYDIDITPGCNKFKKRQIMQEAWNNPANYFQLPAKKIPGYGFDGNKNLYTSVRLESVVGKQIKVRLPGEERTEFAIRINKETAVRNLADIFDPRVPDEDKDSIIAALDIIMLTRAKAEHGASLKMSFYFQPANPFPIGDGTKEIWAGFYASARKGQWSLTLNADVTATVVIASMTLKSILDYYNGRIAEMNAYLKDLKRDIKIAIQFGNPAVKVWKQVRTFERVVMQTSKTYKFDHNGKTVTPQQYFQAEYGVTLQSPDLPLVQIKSGKQNVYYPMEFCTIAPGQFSMGKLESFEQSQLVKHVTMKPLERYQKTCEDFRAKFATPEQKALLQDFGIALSPNPMSVQARVLPAVTVQAKRGNIKCSEQQASFSLGASHFYQSPTDLGHWAVVVTTRRTGNVDEWINRFRIVLSQRGIKSDGLLFKQDALTSRDVEQVFERFRQSKVNFGLFLVEKGGPLYSVIKQKGDRQYKIVTQCVDATNRRNMDQSYLDNLILKVNVKLGGINHVIARATWVDQRLMPVFDDDVLLVGADVTHPGATELTKPSIAAVVGSIDRQAAKYVAVITPQARTPKEGQVCTQEWISDLAKTMKSLLRVYRANTNRPPNKIIFYRDGVSEGQYPIVLQKELTQIQKACRELSPDYEPAITYVVVRKRIKTKFYAEDRNQINNVPPGTLVELDITQPLRYFDYFMVPHFSMLGTARPSHYCVLYDDSHFSPSDIAYLSFTLCHLFPRCTKAVSLPAPVYHAHLAADRANQHLAGKPLTEKGKQMAPDSAEERKKAMDHARDATLMDIENSMPNYWL